MVIAVGTICSRLSLAHSSIEEAKWPILRLTSQLSGFLGSHASVHECPLDCSKSRGGVLAGSPRILDYLFAIFHARTSSGNPFESPNEGEIAGPEFS
jgi:hypothetical protein